MTSYTDETIASAVVLACLLIALFAILFAASLLQHINGADRSKRYPLIVEAAAI